MAFVALTLLWLAPALPSAPPAGGAGEETTASRGARAERLRLRGPFGTSLGIAGRVSSGLGSRGSAWTLRLHLALDLTPFGDAD